MVTLWMRSKIDGTYDGERAVTTVPQGIAENLVGNLNVHTRRPGQRCGQTNAP